MKHITKKIISLTLALVFTLGVVVGAYNDVNATEYNTGINATVSRSEKTGLKKPETVYHNISEEEYEAVLERENIEKAEKFTDSYWSQFSEPYYNYATGMTAEERQIYDKIYAQLYKYIEGGADFTKGNYDYYETPAVSCGNINKDNLDNIHYVIVYEHPELFYIDTLCTISETSSGQKTIAFEVFEDFAKGSSRANGSKKFKERIEWYLGQTKGLSFYDKEKKLHDLLCKNAEYEYTDHSQSAYSALVERKTVCAGYSEGFNMLCYAVGIPAMSVTSASHEWSQVKLGNTWYAVDVTWDDEEDDEPSYEYFNKSNKTITYLDDAHKIEASPWNYVGRPTCPKDYTYEQDSTDVYRLYNPFTAEHFYTTDFNECIALAFGEWNYEGVAWIAPMQSYYANEPVYRLNFPSGDHHYTTSVYEKDRLAEQGWSYEGVSWYSATGYGMPLYRLYNPNLTLGAHHYTTDANEVNVLKNSGWQYEGIGWYGM